MSKGNSTESIDTIVNSQPERFNNNSQSSIDNSKRVDLLVLDCEDLIDPAYRRWFIKRFYRLADISVRRLAASVRETAGFNPQTNAQRLFCSLIKREAGF